MTKVSLKRVTETYGTRKQAQVTFSVPTEATPFNGYKTSYEETVIVFGNTADGILKRVRAENFDHYAPGNSNVTVWTPRTTISWEE